MLHTAEVPGDITDVLVGDKSLDRKDRRHVIFHIVQAGDQDVLLPQQRFSPAPNHAVLKINAVFHARLPREPLDLPLGFRRKARRDCVVPVENERVIRTLAQENILLGIDILVHVLVHVQMVGRKVRHDGRVAAGMQIHQLEGAELEHSDVRGAHFLGAIQKRRADVAANPDAMSGAAQQLGNECGRGRLAVRAGHTDDPARADLKKCLHLRRDLRARSAQYRKLGLCRMQTRRAEGHIAGKSLEVAIAQMQLRAHALQLENLRIQLFARRFVAARDLRAVLQQQAHQRTVAHAETEHQHALAAQFLEIFMKCQTDRLFLANRLRIL